MSDLFGKNSQVTAVRAVSCAILGLCVLIAAPASFAQRAGAPGQVTDYSLIEVETAAGCSMPVSPSIPDQEFSRRQERQLNRGMRRFIKEFGQYVGCMQTEYGVARAENAPEPELMGLVAASNAAVREVEALVAVYEERIGPITEVVPPQRRRPSSGQRDPWAGRPWPQTDPHRFPPSTVIPMPSGPNASWAQSDCPS